jgi:2-keto-3-deoxy-L-rhamnonate aldolase RhmA
LRINKLRDLINKRKPSVGTRLLIVWPGLTEVIGHTRLIDYVEFVSEYAPYSLEDLDNFARAAELVGLSTMIKIDQEPRTFIAGRALASGIQNFLFADIRTVNDAEEAVNAVRAEPKGKSGVRMDRRIGYVGIASKADMVKMCDDSIVALMIEKKSAVENLEEILSVEGIDMVQFGPSDYSVSIGLPGQRSHPKVKEAELKTIKTSLKMDIPPRAEISNPKEAKKYLELGIRDFSLGNDITILYDWFRNNVNVLRKLLS